ncbi:XRE family transcriptional regulator [bacterium]|nr:XRE family transcriptional regulator [bacterium]MBU1990332.1 XRE family transcriptional regulator [bacterium]
MPNRNNHAFKGHRTLLGAKYVTYGEIELPLRYDIFPQSKNGFDWGYSGSATIQLAFSILYQLSDEDFAKNNATKFSNEVIKTLNSRDWILHSFDVFKWIDENRDKTLTKNNQQSPKNMANTREYKTDTQKAKKQKSNIVKDICKELNITQKNLAEVLEVPEGTISSWAVKNEIPRLGKKAIEFYMLNKKNQEIVDSYKNFVQLLNVS